MSVCCATAGLTPRGSCPEVEDDDGHAEGAEVVAVGRLLGDVGVVGSDDEDGAVVPGLLRGGGKEATERHVGVADAGVHRVALFVEHLTVALRHHEGVMRGGGEEGGHEGLPHAAHGEGVVLEELFIPDGPGAVEVFLAAKTAVGIVLCATIVLGEARGAGKGLEAHGAVFSTVEEGGGVAAT